MVINMFFACSDVEVYRSILIGFGPCHVVTPVNLVSQIQRLL